MRVLIAHASSDMYGSDRSVLSVALWTRAQGDLVTVLLPDEGPLAARLRTAGVEVIVARGLVLRRADLTPRRFIAGLWNLVAAGWQLRHIARTLPFDVVQSHCIVNLSGWYLARHTGRAHVWCVHEIVGTRPLRWILERFVATADVIVCASAAVREQFAAENVRERSVVLHSGAEIPPEVASLTPPGVNGPFVVCVGRLNAWKGQDVLIEAFALIADRVASDLVIIGSAYRDARGPEARLRRLIDKHGLESRCHLLGERSDALEIVRAATVAVVPSRLPEPFGKVVVEAMLLGTPVVATNAGGPVEIIRDGIDGLLVTPGNAEELARAIEFLLRDRAARENLMSAARIRAREFTAEQFAAGVHQLVKDSLDATVAIEGGRS